RRLRSTSRRAIFPGSALLLQEELPLHYGQKPRPFGWACYPTRGWWPSRVPPRWRAGALPRLAQAGVQRWLATPSGWQIRGARRARLAALHGVVLPSAATAHAPAELGQQMTGLAPARRRAPWRRTSPLPVPRTTIARPPPLGKPPGCGRRT